MRNEAEILADFERVAHLLSPECLTCDGERSRSEVRRRGAELRAEWRKLEKELGRTMTEDEVWNRVFKASGL